ncbi:MAG: IS481 family transposase, partial [Aeromonas sp.]
MQIKMHVNARTTPAIRAEIQANKHLPTAELAKRYNIAWTTARRWQFAEDGVYDRSHCPHNMRATLSASQEWLVLFIRNKLQIGLDDLLAVTREFIHADMSRSALDRMLRRHKVPSIAQLRKESAKAEMPEVKTFKAYEPGYLHMDIKYLPKLEGYDKREYLFVAIDRCTRWVFFKIYPDQTEASSTDFLRELAKECPVKIQKLLTDNGSQFTDRFTSREKVPSGEHAFDKVCTALNIEHRLIPPGHPQTNGMVERFNGRISDILRTHHFDSRRSLHELLANYQWFYNNHLPMRVLGHLSPIDAMQAWQKKRPELFIKSVRKSHNLAGRD